VSPFDPSSLAEPCVPFTPLGPADILFAFGSHSLNNNALCGLYSEYSDGSGRLLGTYNAEGITAVTEMLQVNSTLTSIRSECHMELALFCTIEHQRPMTVWRPCCTVKTNFLSFCPFVTPFGPLLDTEPTHHCLDSVKGSQLRDTGHRIVGQALLEATSSKLAFIQCDTFSLGQSDKELNLQGKNLTASDAVLLGGVLKANTTLKRIKCASHYSPANPYFAANGILHMALLGPVDAS
jgi:hypothetical protein